MNGRYTTLFVLCQLIALLILAIGSRAAWKERKARATEIIVAPAESMPPQGEK